MRFAYAATCQWCGLVMDGNGCTVDSYTILEQDYPRIPSEEHCHDCNAPPGKFHHPGCDDERCPRCGGQSIGCGCDE